MLIIVVIGGLRFKQFLESTEVKVLLDVFGFAIQRVRKIMPKRHPFHLACLQDLRLVFRSPGDYGEENKTNPQS